MFQSSRWSENIFGSSYLEPERRNGVSRVLTLQELAKLVSKPARPVWASSSNARFDCTIAFLSSSWLKNIYGSPRLESGWINYNFWKIFYTGLQQNRPGWFVNQPGQLACTCGCPGPVKTGQARWEPARPICLYESNPNSILVRIWTYFHIGN